MIRCGIYYLGTFYHDNRQIYQEQGPNEAQNVEVELNKKTFQDDAYHPLADRTCFNSHQMSALVAWSSSE